MNDALVQTIQTLVGGVIGFGAGVFADPCRQLLLRPSVRFETGRYLGCLIETKERYVVPPPAMSLTTPHEAIYYRVRLVNQGRSIARSVRLFLTNMEIRSTDRPWSNPGYADTLMLPWSCRGESKFNSVDLPRGVPYFADLVSSRDSESGTLRMEVDGWPVRYNDIIAQRGIFRFTVMATGENFHPISTSIVVTWNGHWKDLRMTQGANS